MRRLVAAIFALAALVIPAAASGADCPDSLSSNDVNVYRSVSGVEIDWYFAVKPGCDGAYRVVSFKDTTGYPDDVRSGQIAASPSVQLGPGQHVLNNLLVADAKVWTVLYTQGRVYRIIQVDPALVP